MVKAVGEGTVEKGHPAVDQWNYGLDNADFKLTVANESVAHHAGDSSFVPAGLDHSLTAEPGKEVAYIWFERFVKEREDVYKRQSISWFSVRLPLSSSRQ